ncbi:DUF5337 domain-containing protein [Jannaschia sp. S6380]|uniref:DUF5337 family protein n=1 Tax=Jannaschia sp. S6380 TaxID=2926408 RepID=UPI001FF4B19F|nr:DUF5337 family protein [Jannaschia sp. S6380]MCK0168978.1 DUF5337 domain-containing protein [Jannaschia sp. S6380]
MTRPPDHEMAIARRSRMVAMVIVGTALLWMVAQFAGANLGVPVRWMVLIDLIALAALAWAMIVAVGIWKMRRDKEN